MASPFRPFANTRLVAAVSAADRTGRDVALAAIVAACSFSACMAAAFVTAILVISG